MLLRLTQPEMLRQWRLLTLLEPLAPPESDVTITRTDGIDVDALCIARMRAWYLRMLDEAPVALLEVTDIAPLLTLHCLPEEDAFTIALPRSVRRVVGVRLSGWREPVVPLSPEAAQASALVSSNPYLRGGNCRPVVTLRDRTLHILSPVSPDAGIEQVLVVAEPPDDTYVFDARLLDSIIPSSL